MNSDGRGWLHNDDWFVATDDLPSRVFNREIAEPGAVSNLPDGAIGVRIDDDFWVVALLPFHFESLSIQELVEVLWPNIPEPEFKEDKITIQI